jgi:hypothetical protein
MECELTALCGQHHNATGCEETVAGGVASFLSVVAMKGEFYKVVVSTWPLGV